MKIKRFIRISMVVSSLFFCSVILAGCIVSDAARPFKTATGVSSEYQSELNDPEAKALFSFSEFRLLGAENRWDKAIAALQRAIAFDPKSDYLQLILAKAYLHRELPDSAVVTLKSLLRRSPGSVEAHELLGDVFSYQQNYALAIDQFQQALQLTPDSEMLRMRLAMALARLERKDEAIEVLEALIEVHPGASLARLSLARFYAEQDRTAEALSVYRQLLEKDPGHQQTVLEYGKLLELQSPDEALSVYQAAISVNPRAAAVRQRLAQIYLARGQSKEALEQLQEVRLQFPDNLQIIGQIGLVQLNLENWEGAEADFRALLDSDRHQGRNHYYLAMALLGQGKSAQAIKMLEQVTGDSPVYSEAALQLAYLYKQSDQDTRAIAVLQQLIGQGGAQPEAYYYLVAFLGDQEHYEQALSAAITGVEKNPEDTRLLYQLGVLYEKMKNRQSAVQVMENVLRIDEAHPDALNFLAYHQAEEEIDLELALIRAQKALAIHPSGYIADTLGWVYFKLGRFKESREQLENATSLHPDDQVILEHLGDLYRAMELWEKAVDAYRRALEIDPGAEKVKEKLKALPLEVQ